MALPTTIRALRDQSCPRHRAFGVRWGAALLIGTLLGASSAQAIASEPAGSVDWRPVLARLQVAAAPWCGEQVWRDADGRWRCRVRLVVVPKPIPFGAMAVGMMLISKGAMEALTEDELAHFLGHEIAHFAMGHLLFKLRQLPPDLVAQAAARMQKSVPEYLDGLASFVPPAHPDTPVDPHERERDADTLGLYLAGLAGYPVGAQASMWARLATQPDWTSEASDTHPAFADRGAYAQAIALRFCDQLRTGQALVPDLARLRPRAAPENSRAPQPLRAGACSS